MPALGVRGGGSCSYLLWTRACSTLVVLSEGGVPAEFWLITERNFSSSLVLSVFPAPLSPLKSKTRDKNSLKSQVFFLLFLNCSRAFFSLSPDEHALAVVSLPQAAVTLVCHSEDVRRQLPHLVFAVQSNGSGIIQACDLFIWIDCCQDRSDVCLRTKKRQRKTKSRGISDNASRVYLDSQFSSLLTPWTPSICVI